jgi:hypothetical protein
MSRHAKTAAGAAGQQGRFFFSFFSKDSLKYAPNEKILKNRYLSWRHGRRRQGDTVWHHGNWR